MALSNAERQRAYVKRLKQRARNAKMAQIVAFEVGFRCCERGENLQQALATFWHVVEDAPDGRP